MTIGGGAGCYGGIKAVVAKHVMLKGKGATHPAPLDGGDAVAFGAVLLICGLAFCLAGILILAGKITLPNRSSRMY